MSYWRFLLYTTIGAGAWHSILALLGHYMHSFVPEEQLEEKILEYGEYIKIGLIVLVLIACVYFLVNGISNARRTKNRSKFHIVNIYKSSTLNIVYHECKR